MALEIKRAAELVHPELEAKWARRRAGWHAEVLQHVLRTFVERPGPVGVEDIVTAFPDRALEGIREALATLDEEDLIQMRDDRLDIAYPFSAVPTPFVVEPAGGRERYACLCDRRLGRRADARAEGAHPVPLPPLPRAPGAVGRPGGAGAGSRGSHGLGGQAEAKGSGGSRPRSERRSTSSGRKSTCAHGERQIPTLPGQAPRCSRRSGSVSGSSGGSWEDSDADESAGHGLLVHDLTVLSGGERVSFVSRGRVHRQERPG
jgi:hypothetical protein